MRAIVGIIDGETFLKKRFGEIGVSRFPSLKRRSEKLCAAAFVSRGLFGFPCKGGNTHKAIEQHDSTSIN
ncbi:hypothetical protein RA8P2_00239 (plasmid) [Variovorax sp. RA8]|nr:hypothetical protein RA8P2_00239 [Variovorax sp. RA8]